MSRPTLSVVTYSGRRPVGIRSMTAAERDDLIAAERERDAAARVVMLRREFARVRDAVVAEGLCDRADFMARATDEAGAVWGNLDEVTPSDWVDAAYWAASMLRDKREAAERGWTLAELYAARETEALYARCA